MLAAGQLIPARQSAELNKAQVRPPPAVALCPKRVVADGAGVKMMISGSSVGGAGSLSQAANTAVSTGAMPSRRAEKNLRRLTGLRSMGRIELLSGGNRRCAGGRSHHSRLDWPVADSISSDSWRRAKLSVHKAQRLRPSDWVMDQPGVSSRLPETRRKDQPRSGRPVKCAGPLDRFSYRINLEIFSAGFQSVVLLPG